MKIFIYLRLKGEIALQYIKISFIILLSVYLLFLFYFSFKTKKTIKTLALSMFSGVIAFFVVNILSRFTGIYLPLNVYNLLSSSVFGIPGVLGLLLLRIFF